MTTVPSLRGLFSRRVLLPGGALIVALAQPASAAPSRTPTPDVLPAGTVHISPSRGGLHRYDVIPVAGSPRRLVYLYAPWRSHTLLRYGWAHRPSDHGGTRIMVRTRRGRVRDLGAEPGLPDQLDQSSYSLVGETLTMGDGLPDPGLRAIHYWNVATGRHGVIDLPEYGDVYQTSAPGGLVFLRGEQLFLETTSGHVTSLGRPYAHATVFATAGDDYLVMTRPAHAGAVAMPWSHPGRFTRLDTEGQIADCQAVVGDDAGCLIGKSPYPFESDTDTRGALVPLDGAAPTLLPADPHHIPSQVALGGSTLLTGSDDGTLVSRTVSSAARRRATGYTPYLASAYGMFGLADGPRLLTQTSATTARTRLATAPYGPVFATSVSLSPGRLVYDDDRRDAAVPPGYSSTLQTGLNTTGRSLDPSAAALLRGGTAAVPVTAYSSGGALAAGMTTGYPIGVRTDRRNEYVEALHVTAPHRSMTLDSVLADSAVLSGDRLLYEVTGGAWRLYDIAKNTVVDLPGSEYALGGNYLAAVRSDDSIWRTDLVTGQAVQVAAPPSQGGDGVRGVSGDYVAWENDVKDPDGDGGTSTTFVRDVTNQGPVQTTYDPIDELAPAGVVVNDGDYHWSLVPYSGGRWLPLLSASPFSRPFAPPVVSGRTEAWVDAHGTVRAAPLKIAAPAPRMLGNTLAPEPAHPAEVAWHAYVPYDEPLTSCSITITHDASSVTTLGCNAAAMRVGVADVEWDGRVSGSGRTPAGRYHYTITASGDGGGALDSAGTTAPVAGHFTIGA